MDPDGAHGLELPEGVAHVPVVRAKPGATLLHALLLRGKVVLVAIAASEK